MQFYRDEPLCPDRMWQHECASVAPFCTGRGLDVGAGGRTLDRRAVRVELFRDYRPDVQASAIALPFGDASVDYVFSCHALEHMADPVAVLREWLRVVRVGGYVTSIIPDTRFTLGQNTDRTPHCYEWAPAEFRDDVLGGMIAPHPRDPALGKTLMRFPEAALAWFGPACPCWSFSFALQKVGGA